MDNFYSCGINHNILIDILILKLKNKIEELSKKPAIDQKGESVFNFSIDKQILINRSISLFFNQCGCSN